MAYDADHSAHAGYPASKTPSLRQKAEEKALEKESLPDCDLRTVSQEDSRHQLHELLVHQIELEMQNDELQRAQLELEEARARYLDLYDLAPVGYCTLDEDGLIREANLTAAGMFAVTRGALINQPITHFIQRDEQDAFYLYKRQLFETGEPQSFELRMTNGGGASFWAHLAANVTQDAHGERKCRITISDIAERKLAEEALRESERLLRAVIEGTDDPVFLKDCESRMLVANAATERTLGTPVVGKTASDYFRDKELAKAALENDRQVIELGRAMEAEETIPTVKGLRTFLVRKSPWREAKGKVMGLIGIARDITDRKRIETELVRTAEELERKDRLVTDFFINISHEFKTPLTILMLGLELLEAKAEKMKGSELFTGNLTAMKQNSYRLNRLVANLLDITKLDAGFMQPKWEKADIAGLLQNLAQSVDPYAKQRQLSLEYECGSARIPFTTDGFMLERIVLNLLSNAIKHTPAGGRIRIACSSNGEGISISVADTGEGIPSEKMAIIFDRFSQVDTRMTRASEGTGIGLALTKSLVKLLGGRISVVSAPGEGSTFTVKLPHMKKETANGTAEQGNIQMDKRVQMELSDIIAT